MRQQDYNRMKRILEKRIDGLMKNGHYIEVILFMAAIIEKELQTILERYEKLIRDYLSYKKGKKLKFSIQEFTKRNIQKMTLGQLIGYVSIMCENKSLLKDLNRFNNLRVAIIHGLFSAKSIPKLENRVKTYLQKKSFWRVMIKTSTLEILISKRILDNNTRELVAVKRRLARIKKRLKKARQTKS